VQLLVSVTDAREASEAVRGGADIIDVKDPATGALGAASPEALRAVRQVTPVELPVSAALGDGPFEPALAAHTAAVAAQCGSLFVKLGLRDTTVGQAVAALQAARAALPGPTRLIVAGFADFARAGSPDPLDLPELARVAGAQGCLLDTAIKDGRGLLHWFDLDTLRAFVDACRSRALLSALAGSLRPADLDVLAPVAPDIVGVRGAACVGDRVSGCVSADRVAALRALVHVA
jgi:(5-formylfuran-3-yl)methyl phosphate synthase